MKYLVKRNPNVRDDTSCNPAGGREYVPCTELMYCPFPDGVKTIPIPKKGKKIK